MFRLPLPAQCLDFEVTSMFVDGTGREQVLESSAHATSVYKADSPRTFMKRFITVI